MNQTSQERTEGSKEETEKGMVKTDETEGEEFSPLVRQILMSLGPIILVSCVGTTTGYSAILLPQLKDTNSTITVTQEESSWIASLAQLPMIPGSILAGIIMEKLGRKIAHLLTAIPLLTGYATIYFSSSLEAILVGRILTGISIGMMGSPPNVYVGEISQPKYRGFLLGSIVFSVSFGMFLVHLLGTFFTWKTVAACCACIPLPAYFLIFYLPESPSWLAKKDRISEAEDAFLWCRGSSIESKIELAAMIKRQKQLSLESSTSSSSNSSWKHLKRPEFLKPLMIMSFFFVMAQFTGINAVAAYTVSIMQETVGQSVDNYAAMLTIDVLRFIMSALACVLLRRFGRKPLLMISGVGTAVSLFILSIYVVAKQFLPSLETFFFLPMFCLIGYISFLCIGLMPLPWSMSGEVFPLKVRGFGGGIATCFCFAASFVVVKTCPAMFSNLGVAGTFSIYGSIALFGTLVVYALIPETKDKTLLEIEEYFGLKYSKKEKSNKDIPLDQPISVIKINTGHRGSYGTAEMA